MYIPTKTHLTTQKKKKKDDSYLLHQRRVPHDDAGLDSHGAQSTRQTKRLVTVQIQLSFVPNVLS